MHGKKISVFLAVFILLIFSLFEPAFAQQITLYPSQTANVNSFFPEMVFSEPDNLQASFSQVAELSFIYFDLETVPQDIELKSATLSAYVKQSLFDEFANINVYPPNLPWCAKELTWSNKPALLPAITSASVSATPGWVSWDVTSIISSHLKERHLNFGLVLGGDSGLFERSFANSENLRPNLTLIFADEVSFAATESSQPKDPCQQVLGSKNQSDTSLAFLSNRGKPWLWLFGFIAITIAAIVTVTVNTPGR